MPFLTGPGPIRRTLQYLETGRLVFRDQVKVVEISYNMHFRAHETKHLLKIKNPHAGLRDFYFWHVPHIQYKNPNVQILRFLELHPNPFIRCFLQDGREVLFDCYDKSKDEILEQLLKTVGKTKEMIKYDSIVTENLRVNPATFGLERKTFCVCEFPGQVPCSKLVSLPKSMTGKYTKYKTEELQKWEEDLDAPYKTEEEKMKAFYPVPLKPVKETFEGLETMEIPIWADNNAGEDPDYKEFKERQNKLIE